MPDFHEHITTILTSICLLLILGIAILLHSLRAAQQAQGAKAAFWESAIDQRTHLLRHSLQGQEEERKQIAQRIHDDIWSKLNVVHLYVNQFRNQVPEHEYLVADIRNLLNQAMLATHQLTYALLPPTLQRLGLRVALEEVIDRLEQSHEVTISLELQGRRFHDSGSLIEISLFRILDELLQHSVLHTAATKIHIGLSHYPDRVSIRYQDNASHSSDTLNETQSVLLQVESRAQMISSTAQLLSTIDEGIHIRIDIPLNSH